MFIAGSPHGIKELVLCIMGNTKKIQHGSCLKELPSVRENMHTIKYTTKYKPISAIQRLFQLREGK